MAEKNLYFGLTDALTNTNWVREIPYAILDLPYGKISNISLTFKFRTSYVGAEATVGVCLFKNSNWNEYWQKRSGSMYAYKEGVSSIPSDSLYTKDTHESFEETVLASKNVVLSRNEGVGNPVKATVTFEGSEIAEKDLSNWKNGSVYFGLYFIQNNTENSIGNCLWQGGTSAQITFTYQAESSGELKKTTIVLGEDATSTIIISGEKTYNHKVIWQCGSKQHTKEVEAEEYEASFEVPNNWGSAFPTTNSLTGSVTLVTLNGATEIGRTSYSLTYQTPSDYSIGISCGFDYTHDNSYFSTWENQDFLTPVTTAKCTINVNSELYGATINKYEVRMTDAIGTIGTIVSTTSPFTFRGSIGCDYFLVKVVDSRGKSGTYTCQLNKHDYAPPVINSIKAYRYDTDENTEDPSGENYKITVDYKEATTKVIKEGDNPTVCTIKINDEEYQSSSLTGEKLSVDTSLNFTVVLSDTAGAQVIRTGVIGSANYLLHFRKGYSSLGIGCAAPAENKVLDIAWKVNFKGGIDNSSFDELYVRKDGDTMTGTLYNTNAIGFVFGTVETPKLSIIRRNETSNFFTFRQYGTNSNYENYNLPQTTAPSRNVNYNILTTKNVVTVEEGGTGVTSIEGVRAKFGITQIMYEESLPTTVTNGAICLVPIE